MIHDLLSSNCLAYTDHQLVDRKSLSFELHKNQHAAVGSHTHPFQYLKQNRFRKQQHQLSVFWPQNDNYLFNDKKSLHPSHQDSGLQCSYNQLWWWGHPVFPPRVSEEPPGIRKFYRFKGE